MFEWAAIVILFIACIHLSWRLLQVERKQTVLEIHQERDINADKVRWIPLGEDYRYLTLTQLLNLIMEHLNLRLEYIPQKINFWNVKEIKPQHQSPSNLPGGGKPEDHGKPFVKDGVTFQEYISDH